MENKDFPHGENVEWEILNITVENAEDEMSEEELFEDELQEDEKVLSINNLKPSTMAISFAAKKIPSRTD